MAEGNDPEDTLANRSAVSHQSGPEDDTALRRGARGSDMDPLDLAIIPPKGTPDGRQSAWLADVIERQVIPRLLLVNRPKELDMAIAEASMAAPSGETDREAFCRLVVDGDRDGAMAIIEDMIKYGRPLDEIFSGLMAQTARDLGGAWEDDTLTFTEVTEGLVTLHALFHTLAARSRTDSENLPGPRRILLSTAPGEQHMFGLLLVGDSFRRRGWDVWDSPMAGEAELLATVRAHAFDVVGFSLGHESGLDGLERIIASVRSHAQGEPAILVGGHVFLTDPDRAKQIGADGTADNGTQAIGLADHLLERRLTH